MLRIITTAITLCLACGTSQAASTRLVKDLNGKDISVPTKPERVAALSEIDLDICLALGLKPVAAINGRGQSSLPRYLDSDLYPGNVKDIPIVGDIGQPNIEKLFAAKPDLILTTPNRPEVLALLNKIAPTIVTFKRGDHWQTVLNRVAGYLNRTDQAKAFLQRYQEAINNAKQRLKGENGNHVSIVRWNPKGPAYMEESSFASLVLKDMGFARPKSQQKPGHKHSMPISLEAIHLIDGDWLFMGTLSHEGEAVEAMHQMGEKDTFKQLTAVQERRAFVVDGSKWTSVGGPLAALSIVEETTRLMLSRLETKATGGER